ncbi:MAG TPA: M48 family metallopeptidase [Candidatus Polarisedimenticolaceae bacterium]|nr:M48 family metallopeptidase [Candidatus Polarisedimenticolaceae bacterium]
MRHHAHRRLAAGLVALALTGGAAVAQTKFKSGFNLFSVDQDVEIGRESAAKVEQQLPIINDATSTNYVRAIGQRLAAAMPGTRFNYQFKIVNASDVNAFALPGGFMYVNRGLIEAAKNEGQLAGVLAHEMAHVALRHGTNQASKAYLSQTGLGLLGGFLGKDSGSTSKVIGTVGGFGLNALFLKFSRTDEEQADVYGAQTMAKAGYNPQDMIDFFDTLASLQSRNPSKVEQFFSSHPPPANRAQRIRAEMKSLTIQPMAPVGSLARAKAALATQPAARSMQELAQGGSTSTPTRTYPENGTLGQIDAPADTFRAFTSDQGLYRIEYPSNWRVYDTGGLGVTIAPEGGYVAAGGPTDDLVYGVVVNHYAPFGGDSEDLGRFNFQSSPGMGGTASRTNLATATNDLVSQIMRTNRSLRVVDDSQRSDVIDGAKALSLVLSGTSQVTGQEERVTVFTRELPDDHVIYALFIAPGRDYAALRPTFNHMISSLRVDDNARH